MFLRDSHCSCGHFEMRLTYVGHSVQKLWAFFKEYFIGDTLPLVCLWREVGMGRYYRIITLLFPKGRLHNQSRLFPPFRPFLPFRLSSTSTNTSFSQMVSSLTRVTSEKSLDIDWVTNVTSTTSHPAEKQQLFSNNKSGFGIAAENTLWHNCGVILDPVQRKNHWWKGFRAGGSLVPGDSDLPT